ncbi:MAG: membrane assembly protein AsmA, partial [Methylophilaceae bacterium]|nr:membrane assembly protein AsmA [Methylophilaceae bacterium]
IGNETLNYTATPRIVKSIKGQGGEDLNQLAGIAIPLKISGTFTNPKFELDTKAIITGLAKSKLLEKIGGDKGLAVQELMGGDNQLDAIKRLLGKKPKTSAKTTAPSATDASNTEAADEPKTIEDLAKDKLKGFLKF